MQRNSIFFFCFFLILVSVEAQSLFSQNLDGRVVNESKSVADVHVINRTNKSATITDADGNFSIDVKLNDTLVFSAIQFKRKIVIVNNSMLQSSKIFVPLEEFVNELDEVVVRPYDLSGDLTRDMQVIKTGVIVTASTLNLPNAYARDWTQSERRLNEAVTGGGLVPLNPVLNAITGRTKYLKKILARDRLYARTGRVRDFYPDSLFIGELHIPEAKIDDFMYYCEVDSLFNGIVDTHDRLKIWEFIKKKGESYRVNNGIE